MRPQRIEKAIDAAAGHNRLPRLQPTRSVNRAASFQRTSSDWPRRSTAFAPSTTSRASGPGSTASTSARYGEFGRARHAGHGSLPALDRRQTRRDDGAARQPARDPALSFVRLDHSLARLIAPRRAPNLDLQLAVAAAVCPIAGLDGVAVTPLALEPRPTASSAPPS